MGRGWVIDVVSVVTEGVDYTYTSLKHHTLLTVLPDNHRDDHNSADLRVVVDNADGIAPSQTAYAGEDFQEASDRRRASSSSGGNWRWTTPTTRTT